MSRDLGALLGAGQGRCGAAWTLVRPDEARPACHLPRSHAPRNRAHATAASPIRRFTISFVLSATQRGSWATMTGGGLTRPGEGVFIDHPPGPHPPPGTQPASSSEPARPSNTIIFFTVSPHVANSQSARQGTLYHKIRLVRRSFFPPEPRSPKAILKSPSRASVAAPALRAWGRRRRRISSCPHSGRCGHSARGRAGSRRGRGQTTRTRGTRRPPGP